MSVIAVLFLIFDAAIKFFQIPAVAESLYIWPRTSVLGALLWTGYLGGAIATHVRVGNPLFSHVLFPTYVAALLWGGLYLRNDRLRAFLNVEIGRLGDLRTTESRSGR